MQLIVCRVPLFQQHMPTAVLVCVRLIGVWARQAGLGCDLQALRREGGH
jgi:hypothetical protein